MVRSLSARRVPLLGALCALLLAPLAVAASQSASAGPAPTATKIAITVTGAPVPAGGPNNPSALIVAGTAFTVGVQFTDDVGAPLPASYNKDTTVSFSVSDTDAAHDVAFSANAPVVVAKNTSSNSGQLTLTAGNRATLTATVTAGSKDAMAIPAADSVTFDVVLSATGVTTGNFVSTGNGSIGDFCDATAEDPYCADLFLPNGSKSGAMLSLGLCDPAYCGTSTNLLLQWLADLDGSYGPTNPVTVVYTCDKTVCGGTGVPQIPVSATLLSTGSLTPAAECTTKGVVNEGADFCVDYKQSTKDNAGDVHLFVLFTKDGRISAG
jgi:hypothetical protein